MGVPPILFMYIKKLHLQIEHTQCKQNLKLLISAEISF